MESLMPISYLSIYFIGNDIHELVVTLFSVEKKKTHTLLLKLELDQSPLVMSRTLLWVFQHQDNV